MFVSCTGTKFVHVSLSLFNNAFVKSPRFVDFMDIGDTEKPKS